MHLTRRFSEKIKKRAFLDFHILQFISSDLGLDIIISFNHLDGVGQRKNLEQRWGKYTDSEKYNQWGGGIFTKIP